MQILKEITDVTLGLSDKKVDKFKVRRAGRGVILNSEGKIALMFVSKLEYYKLPGGGVDDGETVEQGLKRECMEEAGCEIEIESEIGMIIEERRQWDLFQISYAYICNTTKIGKNKLEQSEIDEGFELKWVPITEALKLVKNSKKLDYESNFIVERDTIILKEAEYVLEFKSFMNDKIK